MHAVIRKRTLASFVAVALLAACGGGGTSGGGSVPVTPTPSPTPSSCTAAYARGANGARLAPRAEAGGTVPNQLYVTYRPSAASRATSSIDRSVAATRAVDLGVQVGNARRILTLPAGADFAKAASTLRTNPDVVDVAPLHYRAAASVPPAGTDAVNDQYSDNVDQWYLYITSTNPAAWATTTGSTAVTIAVIDTGVDETNIDLVPKVDYSASILNGTTTTGLTASHDGDGHGTNVAGLAAALPNNLYGFAGVGYSTHLLVYKIFPPASATNPCPQASTADEALAITDAVNRGASVINLSLGSPQSQNADPAEQNAIATAIADNVTVVAAAGNEFPGSDGQQLDYPAAYSGVVAVGASAAVDDNVGASYSAISSENVASYSNSGPTLLAPGGDAHGSGDANDVLHWIEGYSTTNPDLPANGKCSNNGGVCRALFNGTSQATPQVSGAIALMEAYHGGARSLTPPQVTTILRNTADNIGVSSTRGGAGRLNVANAVAAAHP